MGKVNYGCINPSKKKGRGRPKGSQAHNCQESIQGNLNNHINPSNMVEVGPGCEEPKDEDLSLTSSTFQSKSKQRAATKTSTHHHDHSNKKSKRWQKRRNPKKTLSNNEKRCWSCSTSLELYDNPWKIKKVLTKSDIGRQNRLLFGADLLENLMLPVLNEEAQRDAKSGMGTAVSVWDADTMTMHNLVLKRWASFKNFVLIGRWSRDFVRRRGLKEGDEIGLLWDSYAHYFHFSVLKRIQ